MKNKTVLSNLWFYKYRFQIGYLLLLASYILILFYTIFITPNGLTKNEVNSAVSSYNLSTSNIFSKEIIDLPFKLLQKISITLLGLSNLSIKLPSILLSFLAILLILELTKKWFAHRTAILATIIAITSSQFFFIAQDGTSNILSIIYPLLLIITGIDFFNELKRKQLVTFLLVVAFLGLYTPLNIYIIIALLLTASLHPKVRLKLKQLPKKYKAVSLVILAFAFTPIAVAIYNDIDTLKAILLLPNNLNILDNSIKLINILFGSSGEYSNGVISPIINVASLILIVIGLYFILIQKYTVRSYLILIWLVVALLTCFINTSNTPVLFLPLLLLTATGLQNLIQTWYAIFPRNPYARFFGLIPISFVVVSLLVTNLNIFRQSYMYNPYIVNSFNQDLKLLLNHQNSINNLLVSSEEKPFYSILNSKIKMLDEYSENNLAITHKIFTEKGIPKNYKVKKVITNNLKNDSDRFYILAKD